MRKKQKKRNTWEDHYTRKARKEKYPARSVFKLEEIQQKFKVLRKGSRVLDLGCVPGSWLLYAAREVGKSGTVVGVDIQPFTGRVPENATVFQEDIFSIDEDILKVDGRKFHVVLSDMAPATSGNKHVDSARSYNLCEAALLLSRKLLVPGGSFVCKIFQGEDFDRFLSLIKESFQGYKTYKPQSTRKASREIYIIGMNKKPDSKEPEEIIEQETE